VSRRDGLDAADLGHHVSLGSMLPGSRVDQLGPPFVFGPVGGGHLTGHELQEYLGRSFRESIRTTTVKYLSRRLPSARRTASRSHLLLAGNGPTEALARQLGARHVERMLSEGTDSSRLATEPRRAQHSREQLVLWVGRFLPIKGAPLAVEAFEHVRRAVPTARLVMVGDGVTQAETRRRARELGLSESVEFTGKIDWPRVMRLYDEADVLMLTSIRDSSTATGMEAAARGLPIVALSHSGGGGCDDYPDLGVTKVTAMPVASVATRLGQAATEVLNDNDYQRRSKVILEFAAENTWDAKAARLNRWFAELGSSRVRC
jgi:glycosyltransferase involved in cell wall biosynthesis